MRRWLYAALLAFIVLMSMRLMAQSTPPTLDDFWNGRAKWMLDSGYVGLPLGESDTVYQGNGVYMSYLHASFGSAGITDQCGAPVEFPGCMTTWQSTDGGNNFSLTAPTCAIACDSCPCVDSRDHITAQQYPRIAVADDGMMYLMYEWHAHPVLRTSADGVNWSEPAEVQIPSGTWPTSYAPCDAVERIGPHPNIQGEEDNCLLGAPPSVYVEGDTLYVFVGAGSSPGHMRCYKGDRYAAAEDVNPAGPVNGLDLCNTDPLFSGAPEYGPLDVNEGPRVNPYFDFRYVSSADVVKVGDRYYMTYEGDRGPDVLNRGSDTQFGLGLARSLTDQIDGPWEKFPLNPILEDTTNNIGIGHADLLVVDGVTIMYTAASLYTRGRYSLQWVDAS